MLKYLLKTLHTDINIGETIKHRNSDITVESGSMILTGGSFEISELPRGVENLKVSRPSSAGTGVKMFFK
jgi:hypothetical protein